MFRLAGKNCLFYGLSTVVFCIKNFGGLILLRVSGKARFLLLSSSSGGWAISIRLTEIYVLYGGLIFL